jgi:uncharacterized small protein (DUF1192 family)
VGENQKMSQNQEPKLTLGEANKLELREINVEELEALIPVVHAEVERLEKIADECELHGLDLEYEKRDYCPALFYLMIV